MRPSAVMTGSDGRHNDDRSHPSLSAELDVSATPLTILL